MFCSKSIAYLRMFFLSWSDDENWVLFSKIGSGVKQSKVFLKFLISKFSDSHIYIAHSPHCRTTDFFLHSYVKSFIVWSILNTKNTFSALKVKNWQMGWMGLECILYLRMCHMPSKRFSFSVYPFGKFSYFIEFNLFCFCFTIPIYWKIKNINEIIFRTLPHYLKILRYSQVHIVQGQAQICVWSNFTESNIKHHSDK